MGSVSQASHGNTCLSVCKPDMFAAVVSRKSVPLQNMDQKYHSQVSASQTFLTRKAIISMKADENNLWQPISTIIDVEILSCEHPGLYTVIFSGSTANGPL